MGDEYLSLVLQVMKNENLCKKEKLGYIYIIDNSIAVKNEELKRREDACYMFKGRPMKQADRIMYELNRLADVIPDDEDHDLIHILYNYVKKRGLTPTMDAKVEITKMQIKYGITPFFYTAFKKAIEQVKEEEKEHPNQK